MERNHSESYTEICYTRWCRWWRNWERLKLWVMSPLKRTLSLMLSELTLEKGAVGLFPKWIRGFIHFRGVIGQVNANQGLEWTTEGRSMVRTRRSHEPDGKHRMYEVRKHVSEWNTGFLRNFKIFILFTLELSSQSCGCLWFGYIRNVIVQP